MRSGFSCESCRSRLHSQDSAVSAIGLVLTSSRESESSVRWVCDSTLRKGPLVLPDADVRFRRTARPVSTAMATAAQVTNS